MQVFHEMSLNSCRVHLLQKNNPNQELSKTIKLEQGHTKQDLNLQNVITQAFVDVKRKFNKLIDNAYISFETAGEFRDNFDHHLETEVHFDMN